MCTENTFADLFCIEALKRTGNIFSEFSVYIRKVLSIERGFYSRISFIFSETRWTKLGPENGNISAY